RTWGVKHERSVASSISFSSYAIYLIPVSCNLLNLGLQHSWSAATEYVLNFLTSLLYMAVAIGWWVEGERKKGLWPLIKQNLGSERKRLGDLAKVLIQPSGAKKIVDILS